MAGKNFRMTEATKDLAATTETSEYTMTVDTAHGLTLYQIRQELTKRGIFDEVFGHDGEKRHINYDSCLEVLIGELVKEEDARQAQWAAEAEERRRLGNTVAQGKEISETPEGDQPEETLQERLAREKAERKQAAIERSKQRQADKAYFEAKKQANAEKEKEANATVVEVGADKTGEVEEEKET